MLAQGQGGSSVGAEEKCEDLVSESELRHKNLGAGTAESWEPLDPAHIAELLSLRFN